MFLGEMTNIRYGSALCPLVSQCHMHSGPTCTRVKRRVKSLVYLKMGKDITFLCLGQHHPVYCKSFHVKHLRVLQQIATDSQNIFLLSCLLIGKPRLHCSRWWVGGCLPQRKHLLTTPPLSSSIASNCYEGSRPLLVSILKIIISMLLGCPISPLFVVPHTK